MRGIILAAGKGSRLNQVAGDIPKCLVRVGEQTLIERQAQSLRACGIDEILVVVGYGAQRVRAACGPDVEFIENTRYAQTNSLFSLWMARDRLSDGFVVMNGDVLFHPQMLKRLLASPHADALLMAYCDNQSRPLGDEEMKIRVRNECVIDITKQMSGMKADGENVGIAKFGPEGAKFLVEKMNALISAGAHRDWAPRAFREFALERPLRVVGTEGFPWIEIDYPSDYRQALDEILPLIVMDEEMAGEQSLSVATVGAD